jgi:hypothetical protein
MKNEEFNLAPELCEMYASYLETNDDARLAAVVPLVGHEAAQQDAISGLE